MKIALLSLYELGRPPLALANLAAALLGDGRELIQMDLSLERLDLARLAGARWVAVSVPMYTATRLAAEILPRLREALPEARLVAFGLYAPMNEGFLRSLGVDLVLGGECDDALAQRVRETERGLTPQQPEQRIFRDRPVFRAPHRAGAAPLSSYARLLVGAERRLAAYVETSRGCKHLCRHCPVVPIYEGRFHVVPVDLVLQDIRTQVAAGAEHVSFADPDFFNGPAHALRVVEAMHREFPRLTFDAIIKIEHLLREARRLPALRDSGCLFITTAVESLDDEVLRLLHKGHTRAQFIEALDLVREVGLTLLPTFIPFTPWTSLESYQDLLRTLRDQRLVESVPSVQLAIRLLVPEGSWLLKEPEFTPWIEGFDEQRLGYRWRYAHPEVDRLQRAAETAASEAQDRVTAFGALWRLAFSGGDKEPAFTYSPGPTPPHLSEPWYCCAEPTQVSRSSL